MFSVANLAVSLLARQTCSSFRIALQLVGRVVGEVPLFRRRLPRSIRNTEERVFVSVLRREQF